jgi:hypothetical protein
VLAEDAIKAAIRDYQQKHPAATEGEPSSRPSGPVTPPAE